MKSMLVVVAATMLVACASSNVIVHVPSPARGATTSSVTVQVNDLRAPGVAASTRQAAFGVPMGNVTFDPPERQLVREALEAALARQAPASAPQAYTCDIVAFGVNTNTTPLYWDLVGVVHLKLRKDGREQDLYGSHTERTYLWPGAELIGKVAQESLRKAVEAARATP